MRYLLSIEAPRFCAGLVIERLREIIAEGAPGCGYCADLLRKFDEQLHTEKK